MGWNLINIWVATDKTVDEFATHLEQILDIRFDPAEIERRGWNPEYAAYAFCNEALRRWFLIHSVDSDDAYEDDGDKKFTNYNCVIEIGVLWGNGTAESVQNHSDWANLIYEKLKSTNQYPLMMVRGVHPKLAHFDPIPPAEPSGA